MGRDRPGGTDEGGDPTSVHVHRARAGEEESLGWLIARFSPLLRVQAVYRLRGSLRRHYDPEDLVDEVWTVVLPRFHDLRERDGRLTPVLLKFLSTTLLFRANHLVEKHLRGGPRAVLGPTSVESADPLDRLPAQVTSAKAHAEVDEVRDLIRAALEELGDEDREVLVLRGIEQVSNNETARLLGVAASTATERYQQALEKLRRRLPGSIFDDLPEA